MGSIHYLTRYISDLAQAAAAALQTLLKKTEKNKPISWKQEHNAALKTLKSLWNNTK